MATKKDLVEAHSFSRRRLVTAFVSGAPGGREVEPARPGRAIVGGIALAILLVAGAAVAGVFSSNVEVDYDQPGILFDEDTGNLFVILPEPEVTGLDAPADGEPDVRPVVNSTSARLILGPDVTPQTVPGDELADVRKGATIGIPGAPATVPGPDALLQTGWTACAATGTGIRLDVAAEPGVTLEPTTVLTVSAGKADYLVAQAESPDGETPLRAYAYPIPRGASDGLTEALGADDVDNAIDVPQQWVDLLPPGGEVGAEGLGLEDVGRPAPGEGVPADARVGDTFDPGTDGTGLFTQDGPVVVDDPFAQAVLGYLVQADELAKGFRSKERPFDTTVADYADEPYASASWPRDLPTDSSGPTDAACAVLQPDGIGAPALLVGTDPVGDAAPGEVEPGDVLPTVEAGAGAVVLAGGFDGAAGSSAVLVDDRGFAYPLVGTAVDDLGYGGVDLPGVPESWLGLFAEGVPLSRDAALCPPSLSKRSTCG